MSYKWCFIFLSIVFINLVSSQGISSRTVDAGMINQFFNTHPEYAEFKEETDTLYSNHNTYFWYDGNKISEFGVLIYKAACQIGDEGLPAEVPYKEELDRVFQYNGIGKPEGKNDILLTCLYFYYTSKVFGGLSIESSTSTGWNLPRKRQNYITLLTEAVEGKKDLMTVKPQLFNQYYELKAGLQKYRKIAMKGGWDIIPVTNQIMLKPNDISDLLPAVKRRLFVEGYLKNVDSINSFDTELLTAVKSYQEHHGINPNGLINNTLIASLNVPVESRIETIAVNMERCRWINPNQESNYIAVNIPSFHLSYFQNNEVILTSNVVVGKEMNKTVVFSGMLSHVIFNPYWNVPNSILNKEILPALKKNPNLLKQQGYEWHEGKLRQKPGKNNALGLVKFIFPNSNNIYLHDTPQKTLFKEEKRAFSHGCIRVEKACELAFLLMQDNYGWSEFDTTQAMQSDSEKNYELNTKVPVYIIYFTAWADKSGQVFFFPDIYKRDKKLAEMLFSDE